jgi:hypothetical protein
MSNDAIANYKNKLGHSKDEVEDEIRTCISAIADEILSATRTLEVHGQQIELNVDEIVADLSTVRDQWLTLLKEVFDTAISELRKELKKH